MGHPAHYKTCQVRVSLKLVIKDGAVCGDEDGAPEGQSVVADAAEEEEGGVPEGERDGEEEEGEEAQVGAADAGVEHDAVVVLSDGKRGFTMLILHGIWLGSLARACDTEVLMTNVAHRKEHIRSVVKLAIFWGVNE